MHGHVELIPNADVIKAFRARTEKKVFYSSGSIRPIFHSGTISNPKDVLQHIPNW